MKKIKIGLLPRIIIAIILGIAIGPAFPAPGTDICYIQRYFQ